MSVNFFMPLLAFLTSDEHTIKEAISFAKEHLNYESNLAVTSFKVEFIYQYPSKRSQ